MIVTAKRAFVDAPAGRAEKRYNVGDVMSIATADFERINRQAPGALVEGKHDLGLGTCYACARIKKQKTNNKKDGK